ncbi:hypothetical protein B7R54_02100 [Subtercola boreus]|uniref:Mannitol-1-phosphate 5-dehydrogenase n=1 Tax=Subtercola boreus TaxID=120213 RepID=A0A3E0VNM7_9MICO|nr:hypothetical protein B7R54_02100 [Subtercola boreus]
MTRTAFSRKHPGEAPTAGVRIVHIGLGAFHRAHQAWYTSRVDEGSEWGIAAFTGRSPAAAEDLQPQGGLFTLIERDDDGDRAEVVGSIVEARNGADLTRFIELLSATQTAIITITVTEAGYRMRDGLPDETDHELCADREWLVGNLAGADQPDPALGGPVTTMGRLVFGLDARRRANAGPIAIVPCDNMPANGYLVQRAIGVLAAEVSRELTDWIAANVSFVSTSVDRITPHTMPTDLLIASELTGWRDNATVVTEPFSDWVLSGEFPAGRPAWERSGALFVDDLEPFENRKLWLLNGAHSLLAYAGMLRGHETVAQAMTDQVCRAWVGTFWDEAVRHLPAHGLDLDGYRSALVRRFTNTRIEHRLSQISGEGVLKLRVRIVPTLLAERADGLDAGASIRAIGSWVALVLSGARLVDSAGEAVALAKSADEPVAALLELLDPRLVADAGVREAVSAVVRAERVEMRAI